MVCFFKNYYVALKVDTSSSNNTWFLVSDMLGLSGKPYFGNQYKAVIENKITVVVAGYYVNQNGIPTKNFLEKIKLDILTF